MNPLTAFLLGFVVAAIVVTLGAYHTARRMCEAAREIGYEDGYDAGRAGVRRELSAKAQEAVYPRMWTTTEDGRRVPMRESTIRAVVVQHGDASDF